MAHFKKVKAIYGLEFEERERAVYILPSKMHLERGLEEPRKKLKLSVKIYNVLFQLLNSFGL